MLPFLTGIAAAVISGFAGALLAPLFQYGTWKVKKYVRQGWGSRRSFTLETPI